MGGVALPRAGLFGHGHIYIDRLVEIIAVLALAVVLSLLFAGTARADDPLGEVVEEVTDTDPVSEHVSGDSPKPDYEAVSQTTGEKASNTSDPEPTSDPDPEPTVETTTPTSSDTPDPEPVAKAAREPSIETTAEKASWTSDPEPVSGSDPQSEVEATKTKPSETADLQDRKDTEAITESVSNFEPVARVTQQASPTETMTALASQVEEASLTVENTVATAMSSNPDLKDVAPTGLVEQHVYELVGSSQAALDESADQLVGPTLGLITESAGQLVGLSLISLSGVASSASEWVTAPVAGTLDQVITHSQLIESPHEAISSRILDSDPRFGGSPAADAPIWLEPRFTVESVPGTSSAPNVAPATTAATTTTDNYGALTGHALYARFGLDQMMDDWVRVFSPAGANFSLSSGQAFGFLAVFVLLGRMAPLLSRWLRLRPDLWRPNALVAAIDLPG